MLPPSASGYIHHPATDHRNRRQNAGQETMPDIPTSTSHVAKAVQATAGLRAKRTPAVVATPFPLNPEKTGATYGPAPRQNIPGPPPCWKPIRHCPRSETQPVQCAEYGMNPFRKSRANTGAPHRQPNTRHALVAPMLQDPSFWRSSPAPAGKVAERNRSHSDRRPQCRELSRQSFPVWKAFYPPPGK